MRAECRVDLLGSQGANLNLEIRVPFQRAALLFASGEKSEHSGILTALDHALIQKGLLGSGYFFSGESILES